MTCGVSSSEGGSLWEWKGLSGITKKKKKQLSFSPETVLPLSMGCAWWCSSSPLRWMGLSCNTRQNPCMNGTVYGGKSRPFYFFILKTPLRGWGNLWYSDNEQIVIYKWHFWLKTETLGRDGEAVWNTKTMTKTYIKQPQKHTVPPGGTKTWKW